MSPGAIPVQSIPWYDAYPTPSTILPTVSREQVLAWINQGNIPGKDFVVIDVTRSDHTVRTYEYAISLTDSFPSDISRAASFVDR